MTKLGKIAIIAYLPVHHVTALPVKGFLLSFLDLLRPLSDDIYLIAGNFPVDDKNVHLLEVKTCNKKQLLIRALDHIIVYPIKVCVKLVQISSKVNITIFYVSGPLMLPMLVAKLLGKKVSINVAGLASANGRYLRGGLARRTAPQIYKLLEYGCFTSADQIIVESESVVEFANLSKYQNKLAIIGAPYVDTELFSVKNRLAERKNIIGYLGRVTELKGVMNFAKAIPLIAKEYNSDVEFLIIGTGDLLEQIKQEIEKTGQKGRVTITGWIPNNERPDYYNKLKLLILPSYTEGLPMVVKEAMACGTPVLATPVGGIPDLIKHEETGFIMEHNSPECIAKNVVRALEHPNLGEISQNAHQLIKKMYAYDILVNECRLAMDKLMNHESKER